jgi:hypothetical protein
VEATVGADDVAHAHLSEVDELGRRFGNTWLTSSARAHLAALEVRRGHLDEARSLLRASVDTGEDADLSTVTFSLVATAELALAEGHVQRAAMALGAAEGLRRRAGLRAWPSMRRREAALVERVAQGMTARDFDEATRSGAAFGHRRAIDLVRGDEASVAPEGPRALR